MVSQKLILGTNIVQQFCDSPRFNQKGRWSRPTSEIDESSAKSTGIWYKSFKMKVSLNFSNVKDSDLSLKFRGIGGKMKKNIKLFAKTPVDLDEFLALVDQYDKAIIVAADGSRAAI